MRDSPAFDDEDLWFPAHMSAGDSFSRPLSADGAAGGDDDGIGLPRRRPGPGGRGPRRKGPKNGGVKASSWLWLTLWGAAALGIATFAARKEIATELAQSWLKGQGVPAQLRFDSLSFGHASGRFVLGDLKHPDLSAGRFDAEFSLNPFASGGQPSARLIKARLDDVFVHLSYKDGRLSFGTLNRLVNTLSVPSRTPGAPPKDITVSGATVEVDSDYGVLRGHGSAALRDGRLAYLSLRLPAGRLDGAQGGGDFGGGDVVVRGDGHNELQVEARLNAAQLDLHDASSVVEGAPVHRVQAQGVAIDLSGTVPYRDDGALSGPLDAVLGVTVQGLRAQGLSVSGADYRVRLSGRIRNGSQYDGDADIAAHAARLAAPGLDVRKAAVAATGLNIHAMAGSVRLKGAATADAAQVTQARTVMRSAHIEAAHIESTSDKEGSQIDFDATLATGGVSAGDLDLTRTNVTLGGMISVYSAFGLWSLHAHGAVAADGSYGGLHALARGRATGDDIARLDRGLDQVSVHAKDLSVIVDGDKARLKDMYLWLPQPAEADLAGGMTLDVTQTGPGKAVFVTDAPTAFGVTLKGGPEARLDISGFKPGAGGTLAGDYSLDGRFSIAPVTGARVTARGHFSTAGGLAVALAQPLTFAAQSADLGDHFAGLSGTLAQTGDAVLRADAAGWHINGAVHGLSLEAPNEQLALKGGEGSVSAFLIPGSGVVGLKAVLDAAALSDTASDERFHPLSLSGTLDQDARALTGRFTAATSNVKRNGKPRPVVAIALDNDPRTGKGKLGLRTVDLTFAPGDMQPRDLSQMGTAVLAKQVSGTLSFDGAFHWDGRQTASSGVLKLDGLSFVGAIGTAQKLQGEIDFTSLAPLQSQPGQVLGIYRMDVGLPLSDLAMSLQFQGDRIAVEKATVDTPGGAVRLEPMSVAFDPNVPISGTAAFDGLDFGKVIAATGLSNSLTFAGKLSGRVPFSILGGHITFSQGWMKADAPGDISIKRQAITGVAASGSLSGDGQAQAAAVQPAFNPFQDLAYQAMEHIHYDQLDAKINSQPGGVLDTAFHLKGRFMPPKPQTARISLVDYLNGTWTQKPLTLPSGTPVELYLDVPVNFDDILDSLSQFGR